jgi:hypothetical protein
MEKLVYLLWERPSVDPGSLRARFLDDVAPALLALDPHALQIDLDDEHVQIPPMVPVPGDELPVRACVSIWVDVHDDRAAYENVLRPACVRIGGYLVTESLYRDYGGNRHASPRDWPDGARSPGITTLTVFDKPAGMDDATFYEHWYGHQSPMSEDMQPRSRYVRNAVVRALTAGAPRYRAIVEESWPSVEHLTNLQTFFGASSNEELGENIRVMLDSTKLLFDPATMRNYPLSEYILKS